MTESFVLRWKKKELVSIDGKSEEVLIEDSFSFNSTSESVSVMAIQHAQSLSHSYKVVADTFELVYPDRDVIKVLIPTSDKVTV